MICEIFSDISLNAELIASPEVPSFLSEISKFNEQYQEIVRKINDALPDSEEYKALQQQIDELNKVLEPYGIKAPDIEKTMQTVQNSINKSAEAIQNFESCSSFCVSCDCSEVSSS